MLRKIARLPLYDTMREEGESFAQTTLRRQFLRMLPANQWDLGRGKRIALFGKIVENSASLYEGSFFLCTFQAALAERLFGKGRVKR